MFADGAAMHNFGATYVTSDYRHVGRFIDRGRRVRLRDVFFHDGDRFLTIWHPHNLRHRRALMRLYARLIEFRGHLNRLRAEPPRLPGGTAPRRPAAGTRHARTGRRVRRAERPGRPERDLRRPDGQLDGLHDVRAGQHLLLPRGPDADLAADLPGRLLEDDPPADRRRPRSDRRRAGGRARVLAARRFRGHDNRARPSRPQRRGRNARPQPPRLRLRSRPERDRDRWRPGDPDRHAPRPGSSPRRIPAREARLPPARRGRDRPDPARAGPGHALRRTPEPDLAPYYEHHELAAQVCWKTAIQLSGADWRRLAPRPGLFTIGDYNICGLEDSYLTGLFAANRIVG